MSNGNQLIIIAIIMGVVGGTLGCMLIAFPYLKKKGYAVNGILDNAEKIVDTSDKVIDVANELLPNNPAVKVLDLITDWAKIGVGNAQQLCHAGELPKDKRKETAQGVVYNVLKELNITVDDSKKQLIDAAIHDAVNSLGHTEDNQTLKEIINVPSIDVKPEEIEKINAAVQRL